MMASWVSGPESRMRSSLLVPMGPTGGALVEDEAFFSAMTFLFFLTPEKFTHWTVLINAHLKATCSPSPFSSIICPFLLLEF